MNNGAFGENFPYSNFHDLNMDWIIKIAKDFLDQYSNIQEIISTGITNIESTTSEGIDSLEQKKTELEALLDEWYQTHSSDIANELQTALGDIATALANAISTFNTNASERAEEAIESIPSDYTALYDLVMKILNIVQRDTDQYFYEEIYPKNMFDKNNPYIKANKSVAEAGYTDLSGYYISHTIYLKGGVTYKISKPAGYGNSTYGAITDYYGAIDSTFLLTFVDGFAEYTPVRDTYVVLNCGNNYNYFLVCNAENEISATTYNFIRKIRNLMIDYSNCEFIEYTANLFNKYDSGIQEDKYIAYNGIATLNGYKISAPIKLNNGSTYVITKPSGFGNTVYMALCDNEGNVSSIETLTFSDGIAQYTANADTYAIFNAGKDIDIFMVCLYSNYHGSFIPYEVRPTNLWLSTQMKQEVEEIIGKNKLSGKILAVTGDSICQAPTANGGYATLIGEKCNMTVQNIAESGGTIKSNTYAGETPRFWICQSIPNLRSDADYILLEGGVNDGLTNIGTMSSGYDAVLDDTTLYGAYESMFKQAIARFPGKKIGYILVHKCSTSFSSNGDSDNPYYVAIECCKKWGIPYLDLNTLVPPIGFITDLRNEYTINGDGWHPNVLGYETFYVDQIINFMQNM